ncbi:MAG TPA: hypothetical protein VEJ36_06095 [Nitrososphaerales archaeon]|nr:hypothetical protein [Nitrososphaerales archaeon]
MPKRQRARGSSSRSRTRWYVAALFVALAVVVGGAYLLGSNGSKTQPPKPVILYVNQGNGAVNGSNFEELVSFAVSHQFNTLFFQVYRSGTLLFDSQQLEVFVNDSHSAGLRIFFALYITNSSQTLPSSIFSLGEDGISLDMSALDIGAQQTLLSNLMTYYHGTSAVTTSDMTSPLKPDLLVLETYGAIDQQYIRPGVIGSVEVVATANEQDYNTQFLYALQHSDGVMVFDYAGLMKSGY